MNKYKYIVILLIFSIVSVFAYSQSDSISVDGLVVRSSDNSPIENAIVSVTGYKQSISTDSNGKFTIKLPAGKAAEVSVWFPGYFTNVQAVGKRTNIKVIMVPDNQVDYSDQINIPFVGVENIREKQTNLFDLRKKDISIGNTRLTNSLYKIPGLQVVAKSGMPSEGDFISIRGNNSVIANSTPLIVINGIPMMPDMNESGIIGGFSRDVYDALSSQDIQSITVLKGSEAAIYGSLGSNGVILVETDKATDLDTKVELISQVGFNQNQSRLPVLNVKDYKSYIGSVALTKYDDMADILINFPFLVDNPDDYNNYKYQYNTDWQNLIYQSGFSTDNVLKIKGGDAIAKYDVSLGYNNTQGQVIGTDYEKYFARLNSDVNMSRKLSFTSTIMMASMNANVNEQGILENTNPVLAAMKKAPIFSPYEQDNVTYSRVRDDDGNLIVNNMISNPLAIVNDLTANYHAYDVQISVGLNYKLTNDLNLKAIGGLLYNYNYERIFIPGVSEQSFMPDFSNVAENSVRVATRETSNYYWALNANYQKQIDDLHSLKINGGVQSTINNSEYDAGTGYNTANDFYNTLGNVVSSSRSYFGYIDKYRWFNANVYARYQYNSIVAAGLGLVADASSSTGTDASLFQFYPSINGAWYIKNSLLADTDFINKLNLRVEFSSTGNSRYASTLSKYNYVNKVFRELSGIVRSGIPNTDIVPELTQTFNVGFDFEAWNSRLNFVLDLYQSNTDNIILPVSISSAFGTNYMYKNVGKASNVGLELGLNLLLLNCKDFQWSVGATYSMNKNKILSLGENDNIIFSMNDGSAVISEVGSPIYSFYGYETVGIYSTSGEAATAHNGSESLKLINGKEFQAGDVHFVDQNNDGIIDENDRVNLGSALPDFYGTFYSTFQYRSFELSALFNYSVGNKMYNAVRQSMESMSDFANQLVSTNNRWSSEGQITSMPRASYGDPMGNARFSDRWIEDASYLKLKELKLSYKFDFLEGTTVFVSAENLFTVTNYLGLDPETMYSYDSSLRGFDYGKTPLPRTYKLGFKVMF